MTLAPIQACTTPPMVNRHRFKRLQKTATAPVMRFGGTDEKTSPLWLQLLVAGIITWAWFVATGNDEKIGPLINKLMAGETHQTDKKQP